MIDISTINCNKTIKNLEYYKQKFNNLKNKSLKSGGGVDLKNNETPIKVILKDNPAPDLKKTDLNSSFSNINNNLNDQYTKNTQKPNKSIIQTHALNKSITQTHKHTPNKSITQIHTPNKSIIQTQTQISNKNVHTNNTKNIINKNTNNINMKTQKKFISGSGKKILKNITFTIKKKR